MTDNVRISAGTDDGATIALDDIGGVHHQRVKVQYGEDGSATDVSYTNPIPVMSFKDAVILGLVPGWSHHKAMGERENQTVQVDGEDICRMNELTPKSSNRQRLLTPSSSGEALSIYCEDTDDTAGGSGVEEVTIKWIDVNYDAQTTTVATNGGTVSTGITNAVFVNDFYSSAVDGVSAGNIHCFKTGTVASIYNFIIKGGNKSLVPHRMIPDGHKAILLGWHVEEAQGKRINFRIRSTDMDGVLTDGVFLFKDPFYANKSASGWLPLDELIPARSIIKVTGWSDVAGAEGSCGYKYYLVAD